MEQEKGWIAAFERHSSFTLIGLMLLVAGWLMVNVNDLNKTQAANTKVLEAIQAQITQMNEGRYTVADATRDQATTNQRISDLERRVGGLENKATRR